MSFSTPAFPSYEPQYIPSNIIRCKMLSFHRIIKVYVFAIHCALLPGSKPLQAMF